MSASGTGGEISRTSMLVMRRRGVWEAADTGVLLWRKNFLYFIPFFAIPVWITAFGLRFVPEDLKYLSWIGLWWLKPLFDRLVLHLVSTRFFESPASVKVSLLRGLGGDLRRGLLGDLLWRRFSLNRSGCMPIRVLERLKGKRYRQRKKDLSAGGLNFSAFVTFLCFFLEWFLLGGEILFIYIMFNMFLPDAFFSIGDFLTQEEIFVFIAYCVNYMLAGSLYGAMGFGVYINSRVETEGWDLQILFQKFESAKAVGDSSSGPAKTPGNNKIAPVLALCLFLFLPAAANAEDAAQGAAQTASQATSQAESEFPEGFLPIESIPQETLNEILASPDFGYTKPGWAIGIKDDGEKDRKRTETPENIRVFFEKMREALGLGLRILICLVIGGFAAFVLYRLYRNRGKPAKRAGGVNYRNPLFSPESPEALFDKALEFFASGSVREAWAACLRGSIAAYSRYGDISFPPDATEYGCLALVRSSCGGDAESIGGAQSIEGFSELVSNWIYLAYGGRNPPEGAFEKSLEFGRALKSALEPLNGPSGENCDA